jgi:hypothetical protein
MNKLNSVCDNCGVDCPFKSGTGSLNPPTRQECVIAKLKEAKIIPFGAEKIRAEKNKVDEEKKKLDESTAKARVWMGNQYWDEKAKDWRDGDKPARIHRIPTWLVIIGICILISILITLILNYTHPGSSYSFWIW